MIHPQSADRHPCVLPDMSSVVLNTEQQTFVDKILSNANGLHCLTGGPGSGKTFVTKYLLQTFIDTSVGILATAITGTAATVHSTFATPARRTYLTSLATESLTYAKLRLAKVVASMMTAKL